MIELVYRLPSDILHVILITTSLTLKTKPFGESRITTARHFAEQHTADWRRVLWAVLILAHLLYLLQTLVSRIEIRKILDQELASQGIELLKSGDRSIQGSARVAVNYGSYPCAGSQSNNEKQVVEDDWKA